MHLFRAGVLRHVPCCCLLGLALTACSGDDDGDDDGGTAAATGGTGADGGTGAMTGTGADNGSGGPGGVVPCMGQRSAVVVDSLVVPSPHVGGGLSLAADPAAGGGGTAGPGTGGSGGDESMDTGEPGAGEFACDIWAQDCPAGQKCMPWGEDGGSWNATRCTDVLDEPDGAGETCIASDATSGEDSCDAGLLCWDVDIDTGEGTCVPLCTGTPDAPVCSEAGTSCAISNFGALILCLPLCHPLADECPEGEGCYPVGDVMTCAPDPGDNGAPGQSCEFINMCQAGSYCAGGVPGCDTESCCNNFCTVGDNEPCPPGLTCQAWYPDEAPAQCLEALGFCGS